MGLKQRIRVLWQECCRLELYYIKFYSANLKINYVGAWQSSGLETDQCQSSAVDDL
jgi:hypothetical protein